MTFIQRTGVVMITPVNNSNNIKADFFYVNDIHGQIPKMERLVSASKAFDEFVKERKTDTFKVSAGDIMLGEHKPTNKAAINFMNAAGITLSTIGNHELDKGIKPFKEFIQKSKTQFLGTNMNFPDGKDDKIVPVFIKEINGHKYGFLGIQPSSLTARIKDAAYMEGVTIDPPEQTIKELQEHINKLKEQKIDKIVLLSHAGIDYDKKIAKELDGLDIIIGGHSHDLILDAKKGENLVSSKSGEPVIITQAGRDGNNFGVLSVEFDDKGVLKKVQNSVFNTMDYPKDLVMTTLTDSLFGKPQVIGRVAVAPPMPKSPLTQENPYANFLADAIRKEMNVDIGIINSANLRGALNIGEVTDRDISSITPFRNRMVKTYLSEKELVDALKFGAKSIVSHDKKPGLLICSGIKYTVNKQGELTSLSIADKQDNYKTIDIDNPDQNKKYLCAYDDFLAKGGDRFYMLNKINDLVEYCDYDKDTVAINYIKKMDKPLVIATDGRVKVE